MSASTPPSGSTSPLAFPGAILAGRYRLEDIVGQGGMGSVWRAIHLGLGEHVAVKLVSSAFVRSPEALRRFDNEAKSAARIRSRHVPQVFDNGVLEDGTPFLVMELLHGESLAARVNRLGPIPLAETVSIVEQCARALARAHSLGIVHRDIKPENVYLAQSVDDEGYVAKVLDFGIAKVASSLTDDGRSSTRTGTLLGTPLYMSPEQARGLRSIDFRTDLYSLGLVTYTMLTGMLPFLGETLGDLLLQICAEPLPSLRAAAPALPPAVEDWFQRACARMPEGRFQSAQALVEGLRVAAGISLSRQSDSVGGKNPAPPAFGASPDFSAPTPGGMQGAVGVLAAPSTTGGAYVATTPSSRRTRWVLVTGAAILGLAAAPALMLIFRGKSSPVSAPDIPSASTVPAAGVAAEVEAGAPPALAPLTVEPVVSATAVRPSAPAAATAVETAAAPWPPRPSDRPGAFPTAPTAPPAVSARPTTSARPTPKPTGGIDLGY
jgi:eukaryotic-like serine/threonine-protein kinase